MSCFLISLFNQTILSFLIKPKFILENRYVVQIMKLQLSNVNCLWSLSAIDYFEFYFSAFVQRLEAFHV